MPQCLFCEGGYDYLVHGACISEYDRRKENGVCTVCGERERHEGRNRCMGCIDAWKASGNIEYRGYPPGGP